MSKLIFIDYHDIDRSVTLYKHASVAIMNLGPESTLRPVNPNSEHKIEICAIALPLTYLI